MIIKKNKEEFRSYLEDTSNIHGDASVFYLPDNPSELIEAVQDCMETKTPFTVCAGRTGTTGGCVSRSGALISVENLNHILNIDRENMFVHAEAGVTLEQLAKESAKFGLTLRAAPTESLAFIGGAVSTCASGVRGFGYGSIRRYVRAIEVVSASGDVITIRRGKIYARKRTFDFEWAGKKFRFDLPYYKIPCVKSQAGYFVADNMDLIDLFIGSEGTLGIILSVELDLQTVPFNIFDGLAFFKKEEQALGFVDNIRDLKNRNALAPASLDFLDGRTLAMLRPEYVFLPDAQAAVYFEQECGNEQDCTDLLEKWASLIEANGASLDESIIGDTPEEREKIFNIRHRVPQMINEFLRQHGQVKTATDIAVPWPQFSRMYRYYKDTGVDSGIPFVNFGHIGESHLHFNFLPRNGDESARARKCLEFFCEKAVSLGGTVSAEHGIGKIKKPYLKIMYNSQEIKQMAALKKHFDPGYLMGLDNIFDKSLLSQV